MFVIRSSFVKMLRITKIRKLQILFALLLFCFSSILIYHSKPLVSLTSEFKHSNFFKLSILVQYLCPWEEDSPAINLAQKKVTRENFRKPALRAVATTKSCFQASSSCFSMEGGFQLNIRRPSRLSRVNQNWCRLFFSHGGDGGW